MAFQVYMPFSQGGFLIGLILSLKLPHIQSSHEKLWIFAAYTAHWLRLSSV